MEASSRWVRVTLPKGGGSFEIKLRWPLVHEVRTGQVGAIVAGVDDWREVVDDAERAMPFSPEAFALVLADPHVLFATRRALTRWANARSRELDRLTKRRNAREITVALARLSDV